MATVTCNKNLSTGSNTTINCILTCRTKIYFKKAVVQSREPWDCWGTSPFRGALAKRIWKFTWAQLKHLIAALKPWPLRKAQKLTTATALSKILSHNFSGVVNYQKYSSKVDFKYTMFHYVLLYLYLYVYTHTPPYIPQHVPHVTFFFFFF